MKISYSSINMMKNERNVNPRVRRPPLILSFALVNLSNCFVSKRYCRYPYEYNGGHIQSAKNLYTRSQIYNEYFHKPLELKDTLKRNIFIFHCEFSSERAPT
ncbi:unnamed protein product, partial [Rotaria sordida]